MGIPKNTVKYRKGRVGGWREYFKQRDVELLQKALENAAPSNWHLKCHQPFNTSTRDAVIQAAAARVISLPVQPLETTKHLHVHIQSWNQGDWTMILYAQ